MKVKLIRGTEDPEELVCTAARNDYRTDGVIGYEFHEIMSDIDADEEHLEYNSGAGRLPSAAKKRTLIDKLIHDGHWGPFEHPQATIAIEGVTRVVTHQIVRHRNFTYDQQSLRYVKIDGSGEASRNALSVQFQFPEFRGEDFDVDREGVHEIEDVELVEDLYGSAYNSAMARYQALIDEGVPKEQARKVLPMGIKTNIVMSGNARAWMHILNVRTKGNVQGETRRCADAIFEELKEWMPYVFQKYDEDVLPLKLNP